jgi:hypothetical protein
VLLVGLIVFLLHARRVAARRAVRLAGRAPERWLGIAIIPVSFFSSSSSSSCCSSSRRGCATCRTTRWRICVKTRADAVIFAFGRDDRGGVAKEIQRGFVLRRFEQYLGGGVTGLVVFSARLRPRPSRAGTRRRRRHGRPRRVLGRRSSCARRSILGPWSATPVQLAQVVKVRARHAVRGDVKIEDTDHAHPTSR